MLGVLAATEFTTPLLAQTFETAYSFQGGTDGSVPSSLVEDAAGNLYGTSASGQSSGFVFQLSPPTVPGGAWTKTDIFDFPGPLFSSGTYFPESLTIDKNGTLYGASMDGYNRRGLIYQLRKPATAGGKWQFRIMHQFADDGSEGETPTGPVVNAAGTLYGATMYGGLNGTGTVYQLTTSGSGWKFTLLYNFKAFSARGAVPADVEFPFGPLYLDRTGSLYGITFYGQLSLTGSTQGGVFALSPPASAGGSWTERFYYFPVSGTIGNPGGRLATDKYGNIFGATVTNLLFQLTPSGQNFTMTVLWSGSGGGVYYGGGVLRDAASGDLFSVDLQSRVYELFSPLQANGTWTERTLYDFGLPGDGAIPTELVRDPSGTLYGLTLLGGTGSGTVFQIVP